GTPEAIRDGVNGLLVPPGDAKALADAVCQVLDDPELAERLGRAARQSVIERFSMDRMVTATQALYESLLESRRGSPAPARTELAGKDRPLNPPHGRGRRWRRCRSTRSSTWTSSCRSRPNGTTSSNAQASPIRFCVTNGCGRGGNVSAPDLRCTFWSCGPEG